MKKLAANNAAMVLDVLSGRLVFERTGVKLYDGVIQKILRSGEPRYHGIVDTLRKHRDEEQEHAEWLAEQIRALGGHPGETTDMAALEAEESTGIQRVILDGHQKVPHLIHALLTAELADNAGWDLLVKLADDAGDREAKVQFMRRLAEEAKHLLFVREAMVRTAEIEILGRDERLPESDAFAMRKPLLGVAAIGGAIAAAVAGAWAIGAKRSRRLWA